MFICLWCSDDLMHWCEAQNITGTATQKPSIFCVLIFHVEFLCQMRESFHMKRSLCRCCRSYSAMKVRFSMWFWVVMNLFICMSMACNFILWVGPSSPPFALFSRYCLPFFSFAIESFANETGFVLVPYQNIIVKYFNNWFKLDIFRLLQLVTGNFQSHLKCLIWTIDNPNQMNDMFWESRNYSGWF